MKTKVTVDFETRSRVDLKKNGAYKYAEDQSTEANCMAFKVQEDDNIFFLDFYDLQKPFSKIQCRNVWLNLIGNGLLFSAHNAFFEQCIYNKVLVRKYGWPEIPPHQWRCTAAKASACALPRNLAGAGMAMQLVTQKDPAGHRAMMKTMRPAKATGEFWTPKTAPDDFKILYNYCKIDVLAEEELDEVLPDLNPTEQQVWFLDQKINLNGIRVDLPAVKKVLEMIEIKTGRMKLEVDDLTAGLIGNVTQRNQLLQFLKMEGLELPDLKAKTVEEFLQNGKATGDNKRLLEIRKAVSKTSTKKYQAFLNRANHTDHRLRDILLYHGASTGRWGGVGVQPQNLPRGTIKDTDLAIKMVHTSTMEELKLLYGEDLMPLFSSILRGMFLPSRGCELFVYDYNAIETRVLWWLADDKKGLDVFYNNRDPYKEEAMNIFSLSSIEEVDFDKRQVGKAAVLGLGFQMGIPRFKENAFLMYGIELTDEMATKAVYGYRENHAPVVDLWENYQNAMRFAIQKPGAKYTVGKVSFISKHKFLWIILPSGRRLAYRDPWVQWETNKWGMTVQTIKFWAVNSLSKKWNIETTYGGKIVENIVQAVARDVFAEAMLRVDRYGFTVLMGVHDELISEAPLGEKTTDEYEKLLITLPDWAKGLPLKVGGWRGLRYKK